MRTLQRTAVLLLVLLWMAPGSMAQEQFDGKVLRATGEVLSGRFLVKPEGRKGPEVRQVFKSRKPLIKDVVLLVDDTGKLRFPFEAGPALRADFGRLAAGDNAGEAARGQELLSYSLAAMEEQRELALALLDDALEQDPDVEGGAQALAALSALERMSAWRALLAHHPKHMPTGRAIAELLPKEIRPPMHKARHGLDYLEFLQAVDDIGVKYVFDPDSGPEELDIARRKLGTARISHVWGRKDLLGFRSPHMLLITPVRDLGILHRLLRRAEAVNDALDSMFAELPALREGDEMMMVYLFESQEEYQALGENLRFRGLSPIHALSGGMFFALDRTSRFFMPKGLNPMDRLLAVLTHELTHHWIFTRCPAFTVEQAVAGFREVDRNGHWVVEGFASFVEELLFDQSGVPYSTDNPRADHLDLVANAPGGTLIVWPRLFGLNARGAQTLGKEPNAEVPISWRQNTSRRVSEWGMFYAQSAAACHYLFTAQDGKYRAMLLKYVADYYAGRTGELDVAKAFGVDAGALGRACLKHARR